jgi:hypothetical protein
LLLYPNKLTIKISHHPWKSLWKCYITCYINKNWNFFRLFWPIWKKLEIYFLSWKKDGYL